MSLNGLDEAKVKEAHEAAVAEAGGWYVRPSSGPLADGRDAQPFASVQYRPVMCVIRIWSLTIECSPYRFLLKYASRDEVEILARGSNGVVEMRSNIEQYEDASPLFGFLRYRRRNVLVKYMPEGCSRLIQGQWSLAPEKNK